MSINFSQIENLPTLPAVLRETPNVAPQVSAEMQALKVVRDAAVENLIRTEQGENTIKGGTAEVSLSAGTFNKVVARAAESILNAIHGDRQEYLQQRAAQGAAEKSGKGWAK